MKLFAHHASPQWEWESARASERKYKVRSNRQSRRQPIILMYVRMGCATHHFTPFISSCLSYSLFLSLFHFSVSRIHFLLSFEFIIAPLLLNAHSPSLLLRWTRIVDEMMVAAAANLAHSLNCLAKINAANFCPLICVLCAHRNNIERIWSESIGRR